MADEANISERDQEVMDAVETLRESLGVPGVYVLVVDDHGEDGEVHSIIDAEEGAPDNALLLLNFVADRVKNIMSALTGEDPRIKV